MTNKKLNFSVIGLCLIRILEFLKGKLGKLFVSMALFFTVFNISFAAEWDVIFTYSNKDTGLRIVSGDRKSKVDFESLNLRHVKAWLKTEFLHPVIIQGKKIEQTLDQYEMVCNTREFRILKMVVYYPDGASDTFIEKTPWEEVIPDSNGERIYEWMCK